MDFTWIDALIVVAISVLIIAEIMVTFQKHQMKRQFLRQMDEHEENSEQKEE